MRYCLTPVIMAVIKKTKITNAGESVEKEETLSTIDGNVNSYKHRENSLEITLKFKDLLSCGVTLL